MDEFEAGRDLGKIFDFDRTSLTRTMTERMEECMRQQKIAADDLKKIVAECVKAEFRPKDISAMKKIAKLRLLDRRAEAAEELEALSRVSRAVEFDLFDWEAAQLTRDG
jgi:uncharacterized protein (UPF0335 family)